MKKMLLCGVLALSCAKLFAADAPKPKIPDQVTGDEILQAWKAGKEKRDQIFKQLDANQDGVLTRKEVNNDKAFDKFDTNHDGKITYIEYNIALATMVGQGFSNADANHDGTVSKQEMLQRAAQKAQQVPHK